MREITPEITQKFATREDNIVCDVCGETLQPGQPYRTFFEMKPMGRMFEKIECLTPCRKVHADDRSQGRQYPRPIPEAWDKYPDVAGASEQKLVIVQTSNPEFVVATGYAYMITIGQADYVVVKEEQWNKSNFVRLVEADDPEGTFEGWQSVERGRRLRVRRYLQYRGDLERGRVSMPMSYVIPREPPITPEHGRNGPPN